MFVKISLQSGLEDRNNDGGEQCLTHREDLQSDILMPSERFPIIDMFAHLLSASILTDFPLRQHLPSSPPPAPLALKLVENFWWMLVLQSLLHSSIPLGMG